ncbi:MAG: hypothetical protein IJ587_03480, partial [Synergistaceae bacterium]|nr:hypothetical protein [Synergistaceae bacterium]
MRKFLHGALALFLCCIFCAPAFSDAMLYRGQNNIGTVPSAVKNSQLFVSLEEAGEYFGLSPSRNNDELILS